MRPSCVLLSLCAVCAPPARLCCVCTCLRALLCVRLPERRYHCAICLSSVYALLLSRVPSVRVFRGFDCLLLFFLVGPRASSRRYVQLPVLATRVCAPQSTSLCVRPPFALRASFVATVEVATSKFYSFPLSLSFILFIC